MSAHQDWLAQLMCRHEIGETGAWRGLCRFEKCESPIERILQDHLVPCAKQWDMTVLPQYPVDKFRFDFAIAIRGRVVSVIECDGKAFHSSSQARANDHRKSAAARAAGLIVSRFTGNEIYRRPKQCAEQAVFEAWGGHEN
jgi:very-short-patch-repair endonuclease